MDVVLENLIEVVDEQAEDVVAEEDLLNFHQPVQEQLLPLIKQPLDDDQQLVLPLLLLLLNVRPLHLNELQLVVHQLAQKPDLVL